MRRVAALGILLTVVMIGSVALAGDGQLSGTWHQRDSGTSNIFYFIDEPVGGVYPVVFFDDATSEPVCGDGGPMMASGFVSHTGTDGDGVSVFEGSLGKYWCPDNGDGAIIEWPWSDGPIPATWDLKGDNALFLHPEGFISGGIGGCIGFKQPNIDEPNRALKQIAKGKYPPPDLTPPFICEEDR